MNLEILKIQLEAVQSKISKLEGWNDPTAAVAKSFHLGMVGGSGKNTSRLNRQRERSLDKTISNAVQLCPLYKERQSLEILIQRVESGEYERTQQAIKSAKELKLQKLCNAWKALKVGDSIPMGNGSIIVQKKNSKSIISGGDCKWSAAEIIGKEAAAML